MRKLPNSFLGRKILSLFILFVTLLISPLNAVIAADFSDVYIDGVRIYSVAEGYNDAHGFSGVTFDIPTLTLNLNNATVENIEAMGNLIINITGTNTVTSATTWPAIWAENGNLTIIGDSATLNVTASAEIEDAIRIGSGGRLTIGDEANPAHVITVNITQGVTTNCEDTYIVGSNVFNYDDGGEPGAPVPGDPLQLYIDGVLVIDETADPQVTSAEGTGWSIEKLDWLGYYLEIDGTVSPNFGYITGAGDGLLSISPTGADVTFGADLTGYSMYFDGMVDVLFGMGPDVPTIYLEDGIYTGGGVLGGDGDVVIGSELAPATNGIGSTLVSTSFGNMTIYTSGTGLYYYNPTPEPEEGLVVIASQNSHITIAESDIATDNLFMSAVLGGGALDFNYTTSLGSFTSYAGHYEWAEFSGTEDENTEPVMIECTEEGEHVEDKYRLTTDSNSYLLESLAKAVYQLGYNYDDAEDAQVVNGTVNVIAANGYKFVTDDGKFFDFGIEEGTEVTIELLPDYGYQYVSGGINGIPTAPEEGKASYSFTMPANHVHISAIFEKTDDIVTVDSDLVKSATISGLPESDLNGNAELVIEDASGVDSSKFSNIASGFTVNNYVDLTLNEVIFKGATEDSWKTEITELSEEMDVTLALEDDMKGHTEYKILRDHEGTVEELEATYDPTNGTLSFKTDAYSTYGIAYRDVTNPNTFDNILSFFVIAFLSLIIGTSTMAIVRKKMI